MTVKLLTEHHLEGLSLKGGCRGSSEFTYVNMPYFWKPHALALFMLFNIDVSDVRSNFCPSIKMYDFVKFALYDSIW